jgi:hypothetical protein
LTADTVAKYPYYASLAYDISPEYIPDVYVPFRVKERVIEISFVVVVVATLIEL